MDISPKTLREVTFREKFRGYHPEDVDTFLERVAVGLEAMQTQLRQAAERVAHAEQLATESATSDEALSRTLLLAQRTADMAVEEAREQAARIIAAAESQAKVIRDEATEAARRTAEEAQASLRADLEMLSSARDQLTNDVGGLQQWLNEHRAALTASISDLLRQLEQGMVTQSEPPAVSTVDVPAPPPEAADEPPARHFAPDPTGSGSESEFESEGATAAAPAAEVQEQAPSGGDASPPYDGVLAPRAEDPAPEQERRSWPPDPPLPEETASAGPQSEASGVAEDEPAEGAAGTAVSGPASDAEGADDDPFMAELRRAVNDNKPLGPREEAAPPTPAVDVEDPDLDDLDDARRLGRRRRRR